ncbi:MAG: hypothetical protein IMW99_05635 [Firmicutes bacterium]|nr:hypothetical protein [Bacillota bacterium]
MSGGVGTPPDILLASNGHGEDAIAAAIGRELQRQAPGLRVAGLPLVGEGAAYERVGLQRLGPQALLPSGGFARLGWRNLQADLQAGLLGLLRRQGRALRQARPRLLVAVGDVFMLAFGRWASGRPAVFVATAKSDYIAPHWRSETFLMRHLALRVFARDEPTAASLRSRGVPAVCAGNVMMDLVSLPGGAAAGLRRPGCGGSAGRPWLALLPGSHQDAALNAVALGRAARAVAALGRARGEPEPVFLMAVAAPAGSPALAALIEQLRGDGWSVPPPAGLSPQPGWTALRQNSGLTLWVCPGSFAPILHAADLVLGLAGTANEQAAGLGKPVVAFPAPGRQFTARFLAAQKRLLGEALLPVPADPDAVARAVWELWKDPGRRRRMAAAGQARMGPPGAAARISRALLEILAGLPPAG